MSRTQAGTVHPRSAASRLKFNALLFMLRLLAALPLPLIHGMGRILGWLIYLAPGRHSARLRNNLHDSGLCQGTGACRSLLHQAIAEYGKGILELAPVWMRPYDRVLKLVTETRGGEHLDAARAAGHGVILIVPHLGCFEITGLYYAASHPFTAMHKPPRQAALQTLILAGLQRGQAKLVPTDFSGVRALLAALKRGEAVGILPDHVATRGDGVWAPFFGRPAYTPTLAASLQRKTGAAAFFVAAERLPWGRGYRIHVFPMDAPLPQDKTAAATLINRGVEDMVRRFPAQYMWNYNRHKNPAGVAPPASEA
jgi:KDO2-lipid IV(A) lauroyltransferase